MRDDSLAAAERRWQKRSIFGSRRRGGRWRILLIVVALVVAALIAMQLVDPDAVAGALG